MTETPAASTSSIRSAEITERFRSVSAQSDIDAGSISDADVEFLATLATECHAMLNKHSVAKFSREFSQRFSSITALRYKFFFELYQITEYRDADGVWHDGEDLYNWTIGQDAVDLFLQNVHRFADDGGEVVTLEFS